MSGSASSGDGTTPTVVETLKSVGLDDENKAKWGAVAGAIAAAFINLASASVIAVIQSVVQTTVTGAFSDGLTGLMETLSRETRGAWQPFDLGFLSLPVNMLTVLITFTIVVGLVTWYWRWLR
jgi:hypothetical protein